MYTARIIIDNIVKHLRGASCCEDIQLWPPWQLPQNHEPWEPIYLNAERREEYTIPYVQMIADFCFFIFKMKKHLFIT